MKPWLQLHALLFLPIVVLAIVARSCAAHAGTQLDASVCNGGCPTNGTHLSGAVAAGPAYQYLFPDTGTVLFHASATDLLNGKTKDGTPLTIVGSPASVTASSPFNRIGVGSFSVSNFFKGTSVATGSSFTYCLAATFTTLGDDTRLVGNIGSASSGWVTQNWSSSGGTWLGPYDNQSGSFAYYQNGPPVWSNGPHLICGGRDNAAPAYNTMIDGVLGLSSGTMVTPTVPTANDLTVGANNDGTGAFAGTIYEVYISTAAATSTALTALYNAALANETPRSYLIPTTGNELGHWSADDIHNGTSLVGPTWTQTGTVPLVATNGAASPRRDGIGPFSDSNYYTLPTSNVFNRHSTFTVAMVVNITSNASFPTQLAIGAGPPGWYLETSNTNSFAPVFGSQLLGAAGATTGAVHVLCAGYDGTTSYAQVDNGTASTSATSAWTDSGTSTFLGRYTGTGFPMTGTIYEVWLSTDTPSHSFCNTIYAGVIANE